MYFMSCILYCDVRCRLVLSLLINWLIDWLNRSRAESRVGINDSSGNYWLGNDLLSQLTKNGRYKLRFDLQLLNGSWYWAEYSRFVVQKEAKNYRLLVSGTLATQEMDALSYHDHMMFTMYDRDNDPWNQQWRQQLRTAWRRWVLVSAATSTLSAVVEMTSDGIRQSAKISCRRPHACGSPVKCSPWWLERQL